MKRVAALIVTVVVMAGSTCLAVGSGDRGPEVVEVQQLLHDFGYTVEVDGTYGPQTTKAVRSWQRSNGLKVDGIAGPVTMASLRQAVRGSSSQVTATMPPPRAEHYDQWIQLARCESRGDWSINTGNGYYGGLQFALSSWRAVGGTGLPSDASVAEQMARAEILLDKQGWRAWPTCSRKLGLR